MRATAPFSATMASIGQLSAKGSLQPTGRPVTAITRTPSSRRACRAASAPGVMAPSVVSVSSMSVNTPPTSRHAPGASAASGCMKEPATGQICVLGTGRGRPWSSMAT